jgi:mitotic spindle assembly checkpoint protein MAD2
MVKKYGIPMLVSSDESLTEYIQTIMSQVQGSFIALCYLLGI